MRELAHGYRRLSQLAKKLLCPGTEAIGPSDDEERRAYDKIEFRQLKDRDSGRVIQNLDLLHCSFEHCGLSIGFDPQMRTVVRNVFASDCRILGRLGMIGAPILNETTIHNFRAGQILIFWGAAFRRVVLKGHMPSINFNEVTALGSVSAECAAAFGAANQEFYRTMDWALDISEAEFPSWRLSSIPGELIRRDPNTQVLVSKSRIRRVPWEALALPSVTRIGIEACLGSQYEHHVICAGKRSAHFQDELRGLDILRRQGVTVD